MVIYCREKKRLIKTFTNVNPAISFIPNEGDDVVLYFGDDNEEECLYTVCKREIGSTDMSSLTLYVAQLYAEER